MGAERRQGGRLRWVRKEPSKQLLSDDGGTAKRRRSKFPQSTSCFRPSRCFLAAVAFLILFLLLLKMCWEREQATNRATTIMWPLANESSLSVECSFRAGHVMIERSHARALGIVSFTTPRGCGIHLVVSDERVICSVRYGTLCEAEVQVTSDVPLHDGGKRETSFCMYLSLSAFSVPPYTSPPWTADHSDRMDIHLLPLGLARRYLRNFI